MRNAVTLDELQGLDVKQVANLPIDQIALLLEEIAELKSRYDSCAKKIDAGLDMRFSKTASDARHEANKQTGTVRFDDGEFTIVADLPKKVTWDQTILSNLSVDLANQGEDPGEYIERKLSVAERAYEAWPSGLKAMFDPARTLGTGKATYKLEKAKK